MAVIHCSHTPSPEAAAALSLPMASTAMTLRQVYADAPGQRTVVWNMGARGRDAATETDAIFREILPEVARKPMPVTHRHLIARER